MVNHARYSRHLALPGFNESHQRALQKACVAIIGCGGLGAPVALYLTGAGVGQLRLIDEDVVSLSNLHRQVLFSEEDVGKSKVEVAQKRLIGLNPDCMITSHAMQLNTSNFRELLEGVDLVVDCSDNFPTRYLICDTTIILRIPVVYGAIHQFEGQVAVFNHEKDINYRDVYLTPPESGAVENCETGGVLGPLAGIIGSMQANEAIKLLAGLVKESDGKMICFDSVSNAISIFEVQQNPRNDYRQKNAEKIILMDYDAYCGTKKTQLNSMNEISVNELKAMMDAQEDFQLIDVREPFEFNEINLGALLIPMNRIPDRIDEVSREKRVVVHCKSGVRSASVIQFLESQHGFKNLSNLRGGIMAWEQVYGKP